MNQNLETKNVTIPSFGRGQGLLLGGVVMSNNSGDLLKDDELRRYVGTVESEMKIHGSTDTNIKSILYEIGMASKDYGKLMKPFVSDLGNIGQIVQSHDIVDTELTALHRRLSNFTGDYAYMDLSAVACQLGRAIAKYNSCGTLTTNDILAGSELKIRALGTAFDPVSASENSVYIPRLSSSLMDPATFIALAASVNAYGSVVFTDMVELTQNHSTVVTTFAGAELVGGCFNAINLLFGMYDLFQYGSTIAYAFIKGLHSINTVIAHTDEGGIFRDILRKGDFVRPYGGIYITEGCKYTSLPKPSKYDRSSICAVVDSLLLLSAGGVACCDPGISIGDNLFPTVLNTVEKTEGMRCKDFIRKLSSYSSTFFENYSEFLGKMFNVTSSKERCVMAMRNSLSLLSDKANRHLNHEVIAPFFWIEPTTLFKTSFDSFKEDFGLGPIAFTRDTKESKCFKDFKVVRQAGDHNLVTIKMPSVRSSGLMNHLQGNARDGLANFIPTNFIDTKVSCIGGDNSASECRDRKAPISDYLWGRGQSSIPAPAEMNYIGNSMSGVIKSAVFNETDFSVESTHFPWMEEIDSNLITFRASRPNRISNSCKLMCFTRTMKMKRGIAEIALQSALAMRDAYGFCGGELFVSSNTELPFIGDGVAEVSNEIATGVQIISQSGTSQKKGPVNHLSIADQTIRPRVNQTKSSESFGISEQKEEVKVAVGDNSDEEFKTTMAEHESSGIIGEVGHSIALPSEQ